jgi:hypothetical protein
MKFAGEGRKCRRTFMAHDDDPERPAASREFQRR